MNRTLTALIFVVCTLLCVVSPVAAKNLVHTDSSRLAIDGYDPVAFFTDGVPTRGKASVATKYQGATYRFASAAHRDTFNADPARYAPQFGGFCAYGVSLGALFPTQIETWQIVDGRLLLNKNLDVKKKFDEDKQGNLAKADTQWPGLVKNEGK